MMLAWRWAGQLRVDGGDAGHAVADALGDGLAGPLGRVAEAAVAAAEAEGGGQLVGDGVALGARLVARSRSPWSSASATPVERLEPPPVGLLGLVVEDGVGAHGQAGAGQDGRRTG